MTSWLFQHNLTIVFYFPSEHVKKCIEIQYVVLAGRIVSAGRMVRKKNYADYEAETEESLVNVTFSLWPQGRYLGSDFKVLQAI